MNKITTFVLNEYEINVQHFISTRIKIQNAIEFCEIINIFYFQQNVFRIFNVIKHADWKMLIEFNRTKHNAENFEIWKRHFVITFQHIQKMKRLLKTKNMKICDLTWKQLNFEMKLKCNDRTIQKIIKIMNYHKCIACKKNWINKSTIKRFVKWITMMKKKIFDQKDWY